MCFHFIYLLSFFFLNKGFYEYFFKNILDKSILVRAIYKNKFTSLNFYKFRNDAEFIDEKNVVE